MKASCHFALLLGAVLIPIWAAASSFETGVIQRSDGGSFQLNTVPAVARLSSGKLLAVWSAYAKTEWRGRIVVAVSSDGGRTWSAPREIIKTPGMDDADPNFMVDGKRVFVYSTTVPPGMKQSRAARCSWSKATMRGPLGRSPS